MAKGIQDQAQRLYKVFAELVRSYQFRDRDSVCSQGLSISQCYALEALEMHGPLTMSELAGRLYLEISTVTRIVDHLVGQRLAVRVADPRDRRVCRVQIAPKGRTLTSRVRRALIEEYQRVLQEVPAESREAVIAAMSHMLQAFRQRQPQSTGRATCKDKVNRNTG